MRTLVLSDIHANLEALKAVLKAAGQVERVWCLGDILGYGPEPNGVIETLREQPNLTCLAGNHDLAAIGLLSVVHFNTDAKKAIEWQLSNLSPQSIEYLRTLKPSLEQENGIHLSHGSPLEPIWGYVLFKQTAEEIFQKVPYRIMMLGHSHFQSIFSQYEDVCSEIFVTPIGEPVILTGRHILNPGSVGQPRDRDPRAAFAIFDDDAGTWVAQRAEYDITSVSRQISLAGLPERSALRLSTGS